MTPQQERKRDATNALVHIWTAITELARASGALDTRARKEEPWPEFEEVNKAMNWLEGIAARLRAKRGERQVTTAAGEIGAGKTAETLEMRMAEMEAHAEKIIT